MPLSIYQSSKCAISALEVVEWLAPSLAIPRRRNFSQVTRRDREVVSKPRYKSGSNSVLDKSKKPTSLKRSFPRVPGKSPPHPPFRTFDRQENSLPRRGKTFIPPKSKSAVFEGLVLEQLSHVLKRDLLWEKNAGRDLLKGWGIESQRDLQLSVRNFKGAISTSFERADRGSVDRKNPLYYRLRRAFLNGDVRGLNAEVKHAFLSSTVTPSHTEEELTNHKRIADLRYPTEWYPATRAMQRTFHLHVGPTNSGKTYHALKRLEAAKTGIYAGPLRLLAHEVYSRFNAQGKPCALVTGEEQRYPEELKDLMYSCTVEMVPLNAKLDVAVIDEIQMMGDNDRGWAWTQAVMGVQAKEVHLCGEVRTVPLIKELCAMMGDKLEIHRYERLSPLNVSRKALGSLQNLQKGDAVIVFSRLGIHSMKNEIEAATKKRCAVVYGSLPPETRAQQANLFNDPDNEYDYLVASDAIGMGLNLAIKRVIFESTSKSNGSGGQKVLEDYEIKQIGGRAGRYKTAQDAVKVALTNGVEETNEKSPSQLPIPKSSSAGYITSIEQFDLDVVQVAMDKEVPPLKYAGIFPPSTVIHQFAAYFPPTVPFSWIVLRLHELADVGSNFQLCRLKDQIAVVDIIQLCNLTINDRLIFMSSPASPSDRGMSRVLLEFAECVANNSDGNLLDMKSLYFEILDQDMEEYIGGPNEYLRQVETLHKALTLYLWLSYRFAGVFRSQSLAFHAKSLVEARIDECLNAVHWDSSERLRKAQRRQELLASREAGKSMEVESQPEEDRGEVLPRGEGVTSADPEEDGELQEDDTTEDPSLEESEESGQDDPQRLE